MNTICLVELLLVLVVFTQASLAAESIPEDANAGSVMDPLRRLVLVASEMPNDGSSKRCFRFLSIIDNDEPMQEQDLITFGKMEVSEGSSYPIKRTLREKVKNLVSQSNDKEMRKELTNCLGKLRNLLDHTMEFLQLNDAMPRKEAMEAIWAGKPLYGRDLW